MRDPNKSGYKDAKILTVRFPFVPLPETVDREKNLMVRAGLKVDFVNDENGVALRARNGTYTLVVDGVDNAAGAQEFLTKKYPHISVQNRPKP